MNLAEFECLYLKTSNLNHSLRGVLIQSNHKPMSPIQSKKPRTVDHLKMLIFDFYVIFRALFHLKNDRCCLHVYVAMTQQQQQPSFYYNFQNDIRSLL